MYDESFSSAGRTNKKNSKAKAKNMNMKNMSKVKIKSDKSPIHNTQDYYYPPNSQIKVENRRKSFKESNKSE